jgi:hypothetical protein
LSEVRPDGAEFGRGDLQVAGFGELSDDVGFALHAD